MDWALSSAKKFCAYKSPVEMALMKTIKQALDPLQLMNPGKVI